MSLVIDASAAAGWLMPDEVVPEAVAVAVLGAGTLQAPWLFWIELRNILIVGERRGRLPAARLRSFWTRWTGSESSSTRKRRVRASSTSHGDTG